MAKRNYGTAGRHLNPRVAAIIRRARLDQGWTIPQAAAAAGCGVSYFSQLEAGVRRPSWSMAWAIVEALGITGEEADRVMAASSPGTGRTWRTISNEAGAVGMAKEAR